MKLKSLNFPKKSKTLSDKIRKDNLWNQGESLALVVDEQWNNIIKCRTLHEFSKLFNSWSNDHSLSSYHVVYTICESYLK